MLSKIDAKNRETLARLPDERATRDSHPYFGYYVVDIFDCPPFLMFTNNDCPRAIDILYRRQFEPMSMKLWCALVRVATGAVDIGAHVGVYALAAASLRPDLQIHSFEPNPYAFARLRMHKDVNGFANIVEHHQAVANVDGFANFAMPEKPGKPISSSARFGTAKQGYSEGFVVATKVFDRTSIDIGSHGIIKVDVEGAESAVFAGMSATIEKRPDIILESFSQDHCDMISSIILPLGYRAYLIREDTLELVPQSRLGPGAGPNLNQFLSVRPISEISALMV